MLYIWGHIRGQSLSLKPLNQGVRAIQTEPSEGSEPSNLKLIVKGEITLSSTDAVAISFFK